MLQKSKTQDNCNQDMCWVGWRSGQLFHTCLETIKLGTIYLIAHAVKMWKWYCLTCTGDKAWKSVDRCGFWLQKAFSSSGSLLPSSPLGSILCYLHSLYLTWDSESCAVAPKGRKDRTGETASAILQLTQPPTSPVSVLISRLLFDLLFPSLLPGPGSCFTSPSGVDSAKLALSLLVWGLSLLCVILPQTCSRALIPNSPTWTKGQRIAH